uniref:Integrase catalytic domain-containing protein n=1 Tax=Strix occidentalis caurina TaxID=311401 RepID=A0A8D0FT59_STROC
MLSKRGISYNETSVRRLLKWCRNHGYPADAVTALEPAKWAEVGERLWDAMAMGDQHASELATTWKLLSDTLKALRADQKAAQQASVLLEQSPGSLAGKTASSASSVSGDCKNECSHCPPGCPCHHDNLKNQEAGAISKMPPPKSPRAVHTDCVEPSAPPAEFLYPLLPDDSEEEWSDLPSDENQMVHSNDDMLADHKNQIVSQKCVEYDPRNRWTDIHRKAMSEGVILSSAFPVTVTQGQPNKWVPFHWDMIKEVRKSVQSYGLMAPFTQALLDNIFGAQILTPYDCQQMADMLLTPTQRLLWKDKWHKLCADAALANLARQQGDPLYLIGFEQLTGTGAFLDIQLQARLPTEALRTTARLALKALMTLPEEGWVQWSYTQIRQGNQEPYMAFIDKLRDALNRQFANEEAKMAILMNLAIENANEDCKRILLALPRDASLTSRHVQRHLKSAFAVLGIPVCIKTDNGPCYIAQSTRQFLNLWGVSHITGIPHFPTGQAIIERMNQTLKRQLQKQKGGEGNSLGTPHNQLPMTSYTLNFLNRNHSVLTATEHHFTTITDSTTKLRVLYKDPEGGPTWRVDLWVWGRGMFVFCCPQVPGGCRQGRSSHIVRWKE